MTSEQRELLETEYLTKLMRRDAAAWRRWIAYGENAAEPFDSQTLKEIARMKRVRLAGYQRPLQKSPS